MLVYSGRICTMRSGFSLVLRLKLKVYIYTYMRYIYTLYYRTTVFSVHENIKGKYGYGSGELRRRQRRARCSINADQQENGQVNRRDCADSLTRFRETGGSRSLGVLEQTKERVKRSKEEKRAVDAKRVTGRRQGTGAPRPRADSGAAGDNCNKK